MGLLPLLGGGLAGRWGRTFVKLVPHLTGHLSRCGERGWVGVGGVGGGDERWKKSSQPGQQRQRNVGQIYLLPPRWGVGWVIKTKAETRVSRIKNREEEMEEDEEQSCWWWCCIFLLLAFFLCLHIDARPRSPSSSSFSPLTHTHTHALSHTHAPPISPLFLFPKLRPRRCLLAATQTPNINPSTSSSSFFSLLCIDALLLLFSLST